MNTHPWDHYAIHRSNERAIDSNARKLDRMIMFYAPQAVVTDLFFTELGRLFNWGRLKNAYMKFIGIDTDCLDLQDSIEEKLGVDLPLEPESIGEMLAEVRRFKWLEAEQAGRDIWAETSPSDPEAGALREWFRRHYGAWYLARKKSVHA